MLLALAQAATTVVETVTETPSTVPVEIVRQPESGWSATEVFTLAFAALSLLVSMGALAFSFKSWKMQGPVAKIRISEYDPSLGVWVSIVNVGRETGLLEPVQINGANGYDWCVLPVSDFSFCDQPNQCKMLQPGEYISGSIDNQDFARVLLNSDAELKDIGVRARFAGRELNVKVPRKIRREMRPYVLKYLEKMKN